MILKSTANVSPKRLRGDDELQRPDDWKNAFWEICTGDQRGQRMTDT